MGIHGAALRRALGAQLGHRRLHRPAQADRDRRATRRRGGGRESAARDAGQSLQPIEPPRAQRALHRRRSGSRLPRFREAGEAPSGAAHCGAGGLRGGTAHQARGSRNALRKEQETGGAAHQGPARFRGVRGAARKVRRRLAGLAGGLSESPLKRGRNFLPEKCRTCGVPRLAAMDGAPAARGRPAPRARARHAARSLRGSRARRRSRRRGGVVGPGRVRGRRLLRRAARRIQPARPGLGPAALFAARAARQGLPTVRRAPARQHAGGRGVAHGPRHGAVAPVVDPAGREARARRLRPLSAPRAARDPRRREPPRALPGDRRGPRHGDGRHACCAQPGGGAFLPAAALREGFVRRVLPAGGVSARGAGVRDDARPADLARLLGRARLEASATPWSYRRFRQGNVHTGSGPGAARPSLEERRARSIGALGACVHRPHAGEARHAAARGRARDARAGESSGHRRTAPELAAQAAARARALGRRAAGRRARRGDGRAQYRQGRAPDCAGRHLSPAVSQGVQVQGRNRARALPGRPRHKPCLCLAVPQGTTGKHARLRRDRPWPGQSRDRYRSGTESIDKTTAGARHGDGSRPRAEPHGGAARGQRLVARRAGEGQDLALRAVLRYRLGARQAAAAGAWQALRRSARRAQAGEEKRQVERALLRAPLSR